MRNLPTYLHAAQVYAESMGWHNDAAMIARAQRDLGHVHHIDPAQVEKYAKEHGLEYTFDDPLAERPLVYNGDLLVRQDPMQSGPDYEAQATQRAFEFAQANKEREQRDKDLEAKQKEREEEAQRRLAEVSDDGSGDDWGKDGPAPDAAHNDHDVQKHVESRPNPSWPPAQEHENFVNTAANQEQRGETQGSQGVDRLRPDPTTAKPVQAQRKPSSESRDFT